MTTKLVNVRLPEKLYSEGKEIVDLAGYANFQEFVKEALRHAIREIRGDQALIRLQQSFGSARGKPEKPFTSEIKNAIAEKLAQNLDKQDALFRRVGL